MSRRIAPVAGVLLLFVLLLPTRPAWAEGDSVRVAASIPPQGYFISRIGGQHVEVEILLPPGSNPTTFEPSPSQMRHISKARAYFSMGLPVEKRWLDRLREINPDMRIAPMYKGIERMPLPQDYEEVLSSRPLEAEHGHPDPHIWLSPPLARIMARNARDELIRIDPGNASFYRAGFADLAQSINELDSELLEMFRDPGKRDFLVYHPSWGYFARTYGLVQIPVRLGGERLTPRRMGKLISLGRERGLNTIFYQPQFPERPVKQIAVDLNGDVRELDPLAADWEDNLRECARRIQKSLQ